MLNTTKKLLDPETKNLNSVQTEPRTQNIEKEDPCAKLYIYIYIHTKIHICDGKKLYKN